MRRAFAALALAASLSLPVPAPAERISSQWMEILMNGKKMGFSHQAVHRSPKGFRIESKALMKLEVGGATQDISISSAYFLDPSHRPVRFTYMQKMLNHRQFFEGVAKGDVMEITVESAGNVTKKTVPLEDRMYMADAMSFLVGQKKLAGGEKFTYRVFVEALMATETMTVEVGKPTTLEHEGKKEPVFPVTMRLRSFLTVSYITPDGRVLREISPMGFVSQAVDEKRAVEFSGGPLPFTDLLAFSLIPVEPPIGNAREIISFSANVSGLSAPDILPQDGRQKTASPRKGTGAGAELHTVDLAVRANIPPAGRGVPRPVTDTRFAEFLKPDFEAQSDDPAIVKTAGDIVKGEGDAWRAAVKINRWVHGNVEKKYVDTFSAVATLKSLEGECQSHTNLFAALARAAGVPARTVSGIVYSDEFKGFLYHAWPEVWAGEWVAMDPTFGQDVADATHIKLVEGDLSSQLKLFSFIGKIGVEVVSVERKK